MIVFLSLFTLTTFANTFEWKGSNSFSLKIDSRSLVYVTPKKKVEAEIKPCNLPLVRSLNAELMNLVPQMNEPTEGKAFMVDGNTYLLASRGKEASILNVMDKKIDFYREEESKACKKKGP